MNEPIRYRYSLLERLPSQEALKSGTFFNAEHLRRRRRFFHKITKKSA